MNISPAKIANSIVNAGSYSNEQIAYIVILVLFFISIAIVSASVVGIVMAIKRWLKRDKKNLFKMIIIILSYIYIVSFFIHG